MSKTNKARQFNVTARIVTLASVEITAENFEAALAKANALKDDDFVSVNGDCVDGSVTLVSITDDKAWTTD